VIVYVLDFEFMYLHSGYACLFALQREVKQLFHIADDGSRASYLYGVAASFIYLGNFTFRLGHNIIFSYFYPRTRVLISMVSMGLSMGIISCLFFFAKEPSLFWVFVAYAFGGVGIGTFESNLLSTIAPLGKQTKLWAIIGIPVGVNTITVGGFLLLETGLNAGFIFLGVLVFDAVGIGLFLVRIYKEAGTGNAVSLFDFFLQIRHWRNWFPAIKWHSLALLVDMLCVSLFSPGVMLYIYDMKKIHFPVLNVDVDRDVVFAIYDACFFLGDTLSRKIFYPVRTIFPLVFWAFALVGLVGGLSNVVYLMFLSPLFISFCNGSIYAQANRHIDTNVSKEYSLIAFSFWLFIGDIGSVIGSNLINTVNVEVRHIYHTGSA